MWQSIVNFFKTLTAPIADYWAKAKNYIITLGLILLVLKFREMIFNFLVNKSNEDLKKAQDQSDKLQATEKTENDKSEALQQQAAALDENKPAVDENWYKQ